MVQFTTVTFASLLLIVPILAAPVLDDGKLAGRDSRVPYHPRELEQNIRAREPRPPPVRPPGHPPRPVGVEETIKAREPRPPPVRPPGHPPRPYGRRELVDPNILFQREIELD